MQLSKLKLNSLKEQAENPGLLRLAEVCSGCLHLTRDAAATGEYYRCFYVLEEEFAEIEHMDGEDVPKECPYIMEHMVLGEQEPKPKSLFNLIEEDEDLLIDHMDQGDYGNNFDDDDFDN